jgi:hypothetical protein
MAKIQNMQQLRERVLQAIEDLEDGKIELAEASTIAKLSETVISGLKSEMQYAILTNSEPHIPFYGKESGKTLEASAVKKLL